MLEVFKFLIASSSMRYSLVLLKRFRGQQTITMRPSSTVSMRDYRKEYSNKALEEEDPVTKQGPFALFKAWLDEACSLNVLEPNAMCLATCQNNKPSSRFVLLKEYDERGFVWYTNYNSRKASDLAANPNASLTFWWGTCERSVRIEGVVSKVSSEESDAYFNARPRGSQIGAWSSNQSHEIAGREGLDKQEKEIIERFKDVAQIPRPPHWGGYRLTPSRIEFWKGRESRIHDRIVFERPEGATEWTAKRLQP